MTNRPVACVPEEDSAPKQRKPKKGSSSKKNMHNKDLGRKGEEAAARYLVRRGYDIVERNWTCIAGEADIIAFDGDTIVFVEVKTRTSAANGLPGEAVTKEKRARYEKIACLYLEHSEVTDVLSRSPLSDPIAHSFATISTRLGLVGNVWSMHGARRDAARGRGDTRRRRGCGVKRASGLLYRGHGRRFGPRGA